MKAMIEYSRVQQMIIDEGETWKLSPTDRDALRHILGVINSMANDLAEATGLSVPEILSHHDKAVENERKRTIVAPMDGDPFLKWKQVKP